jgi:NAD(P)-dependent dehydrogenase (short-subunit alcohol dehydrogenase family)
MTMASMDGTVALVTGAASGLGKAVATGLAREGALVVVVGDQGPGRKKQ